MREAARRSCEPERMPEYVRRTVAPGVLEYRGPRGVTFQVQASVAGRRLSRSFPTLKAAQAWLRTQRELASSDPWANPSGGLVTVRSFSASWIAERTLAPSTRGLYIWLFEHFIDPTFGGMKLIDVSPAQVRRWNAKLARSSSSNAAKSYRLLRSIFATAVKDGALSRNPVDVDKAGRETSPERPLIDAADVLAIVGAMPDHLRLAGLLGAFCGLRRGELLELRRADVDLLRRTVRVERSASWVVDLTAPPKENGKQTWIRVVGPPKTQAARRTITLPAPLLPDLEVHLLERVSPEAEALIFTDKRGRAVNGARLSTVFAQAARATGHEGVHLHDLRHAAGTLRAQHGATLKEIMAFMGHTTSGVAMRYQHVAQSREEMLADRMSEAIATAQGVRVGTVTSIGREPDPAQTALSNPK